MSINDSLSNPLIVIHSMPTWLPQTQTWLYNQVKHLPSVAINSHIVCERKNNLKQFLVPNIHCSKDNSKLRYLWDKGLRYLRIRRHLGFLEKITKETNAQVLHSHFGNIGWANISVAKKTGMKHVVTFYGYDVNMLPTENPGWKKRYAYLFSNADLFLCEGPFMAQSLVSLGCPAEKVQIHHLGVETDKILFKPRKWHPDKPFRVLIAASCGKKRNTICFTCSGKNKGSSQLGEMSFIIKVMQAKAPGVRKEKTSILKAIKQNNLKQPLPCLVTNPTPVYWKNPTNIIFFYHLV